jgi:hypothetical protein
MLLIFDIEVVIYFFLLNFCVIGVSVFWLEFVLPVINLIVLFTDQLDQALVFIHEMGILCQQKFNFILQIVVILCPFDLVKKFLVDGHEFWLQLPASGPPNVGLAVGVW